MKKYLLNYFLVGAAALLTVVGLQSFETVKSAGESQSTVQSCSGNFVWYNVKLSSTVDCAEPGSISAEDLDLHEILEGIPLQDMAQFTFDQSTAEFETGCEELREFICAVGYDPDNANFSDTIEDGYWVPTSAPICVICRD